MLIVNGYDVMALQEGLFNLRKDKHILSPPGMLEAAVIERAKVSRMLRIKPSTPPPPQSPKPGRHKKP